MKPIVFTVCMSSHDALGVLAELFFTRAVRLGNGGIA